MSDVHEVYVAETAVVSGAVSLGPGCSVWHGAVLRADEAPITVGPMTNIQDNAVVHVSHGHPVVLGQGVTVGHGAIVHGCSVGDNSLIGMGAIVLDGACVGSNCIVGAGALVVGGMQVPDNTVVVGSPARTLRALTEQDRRHNRSNAEAYVRLAPEQLSAHAPVNAHEGRALREREDEPRVVASSMRRQSSLHEEEGTTTVGEGAMNIRRARTNDIPGIAKLLRQVAQVHADGRPDLFMSGGTKYTDDELVQIIADDTRPIFVAVDEDEQVLGYAFCQFEDYTHDTVRTHIRSLYIDDICVDEAARGRHVGSSVYEYVIAYAREQGFYNVTLNVWSCNPAAQRFYEAMGMTAYKVGMEQIL